MGKALFVTDIWSSSATIVTSIKDAATPITNLLDINPARVVLSSISAQSFSVTLINNPGLIDSFVLCYTTTVQAHGWRIEGAATLAGLGTSNLINSGATALEVWPPISGQEIFPFRHLFWRAPTPQTCGAVRITVVGLPQFSVGHCKVGLALEPLLNYSQSAGYGYGYQDPSVITPNPSGPDHILANPRRQSARMTLEFVTKAEADNFAQLSYFYGESHPIFVVFDPDDDEGGFIRMINALVEWQDPPVSSASAGGRYTIPLRFREYGP